MALVFTTSRWISEMVSGVVLGRGVSDSPGALDASHQILVPLLVDRSPGESLGDDE